MRLFVTVFLLASAVIGQQAAALKKATIEDFVFMQGCWVMERPERNLRIDEHWMAPAGGMMIGMSRTVKDGKTVGWEFMRIEASENGAVFASRPKENSAETVFRLTPTVRNEFRFENPDHDFPQRVIYRSGEADVLAARIEGTQGGKESGIDFKYKRSDCR